MSDTRDDKRGRRAWELAGRQHGVVARRQLLALGFNAREIEHRVARGRLHPVRRGVYAVGWPAVTKKQRWMAAVLVCGDGAMLSHGSAAALWEIAGERPHTIDISVMRRAELRQRGLRVRGRASLRAESVTSHDRIPVTTPVQTLIDLSTELAPVGVERAVNEADKRDLIDPETLRAELDGHLGEPGAKTLRALLDKRTFRLSDSNLEILFRPIAAAAGLPVPLTRQRVNGFTVDFFWPELGLVVETDGLRYHRTPATQTRDARRDRAHVLAGMTPLRFTHYEIKHQRAQVRSELTRAATAVRARAAQGP